MEEDAHESTTKRPKRDLLLTALNRLSFFLLIFSASYWVFLVPRLAYEFARRGMDGVWSYLAHLAFMADRGASSDWSIAWVNGRYALVTIALGIVYVKTRTNDKYEPNDISTDPHPERQE